MEKEFINLPRRITVSKAQQKTWQQWLCPKDCDVQLNKSNFFFCANKEVHYKQTGFQHSLHLCELLSFLAEKVSKTKRILLLIDSNS